MASHLTFEERQFLYRLNKKGIPKAEIAQLMGRDCSTITVNCGATRTSEATVRNRPKAIRSLASAV